MSEAAVAAQFKALAEQAAAIALADFNPRLSQIERAVSRIGGVDPDQEAKTISPVLRWVAGVAAAIIAFIITAALAWVASSVTEMQQTLARIDERQKASSTQLDSRFADYDRRISRLEQYHSIEAKQP